MKLQSVLLVLTISVVGVLSASTNCDCQDNCRRKVKVTDDYHPEIKVVYTGTPCACQKALPFRVEKPIQKKEKLHKHKYNVEIKKEDPKVDCRYVYNTKVEKPVVERQELSKYPVRVEKLLEECKNNPRFIYSVKIEKPVKECETQLDGLVAKVDKIVVPLEDCPQPCCQKSSEEAPCNKIKKNKKPCIVESVESSEEICFKSKKVPPKVKGCLKCEAIVSEEEGCGCASSSSSEEVKYCDDEAQTSEGSSEEPCDCGESSEEIVHESSEECPKKKYKKCDESSEEVPEESSEECHQKKYKKCEESSEEVPEESSEECHQKKYKKCDESSEEVPEESSEECHQKKYKKCEESSEEVPEESSEECHQKKHKKIVQDSCKCESSEEILSESSEECIKPCKKPCKESSEEETQEEVDYGHIYDEEHWCQGRPIKISRKHSFRHNSRCGL